MTTVGAGKYSYRLISDWAKLPAGQTFGQTSAIATDSQDRVYLFQRKDPPVLIFDREGNLIDSWGNGNFRSPHGFNITGDVVYLTDREGSVAMKYTLDGKPLQILGTHGFYSDTGCEVAGEVAPRSAGPFNFPTELVPDAAGDLYVSDGYRNARVHRFSADGGLISSWGEPGKGGSNQFHLPHSLVVGWEDGRVYLCDRENGRVQVFSAGGEYITMWTDMERPLDISQDTEGMFYISEGNKGDTPAQISVRDSEGKVLARWPSRSAHGSWVDAHGDIHLALGAANTVDKYVRVG